MRGSVSERILRLALAFAFIYPAVSAWFNPYAWVGYFPPAVLDIAGSNDIVLLHVFGVTEILIGLWLIFGKKIIWPSTIASLYLIGIVVFNLNQMDVIFRDISILAIALALIAQEWIANKSDMSLTTEQER
ncbi:MAG: hypothetical protein CMI56_03340 [Parcubacteria group bacterium]|nr:hypothetical protein [Parcubacteria group bacterium]|tara:strand:- start:140 stop:532 length:393 start_codon:yes stop_codon:yes gene_type:complete